MTTRRFDAQTPDDPTPEDVLYDALRDNLSPQAVATIAASLQTARVDNDDVQRQVDWFREMLVEMLGEGEFDRLADEVGL
jgi:hypothetical protein